MRWTRIFPALVLLSCMLLVLGQSNAAVPLLTQDARVLHIQAIAEVLGPEGVPTQPELHELWFDSVTLDTRYSIEGVGATDKVIMVRQGRMVRMYHPGDRRLIIHIAATDDAKMLDIADQLLEYKRALQRRELQPVEEGVIGGRPAIRVERRALSEPLLISSWLDKQTLLPLKELFFQTTPDGNRTEIQTRVWTYTTIEHVAQDQLPADTFSIAVPADVTQVTYRYMTVTDAATFDEFDVYYLGDSYNGLPLFGITYLQATGPEYAQITGSEQQPLISLDVVYAEPFTPNGPPRPDQLSLVQQPAHMRRPREVAPGVPAVGESIQVNGRQATLYEQGGGVDLELQLGNTLITIHGRNRQDVLQAAASLQRLN